MQRPRVNAPPWSKRPGVPICPSRPARQQESRREGHQRSLQPVAANCTQSHLVGLTCVSAQISSHPVAPNRTGLHHFQPVAANCSTSHLSPSLRFLRYLGVKYLQLLAASCSKLQHLQQIAPHPLALNLDLLRLGLTPATPFENLRIPIWTTNNSIRNG